MKPSVVAIAAGGYHDRMPGMRNGSDLTPGGRDASQIAHTKAIAASRRSSFVFGPSFQVAIILTAALTLLIAEEAAAQMTISVNSVGARTDESELQDLGLHDPTTGSGRPLGMNECVEGAALSLRMRNVPPGEGPIEVWTGTDCHLGSQRTGGPGGGPSACEATLVERPRTASTEWDAVIPVDDLWRSASAPEVSGCDSLEGLTEEREFYFLPMEAPGSTEDVSDYASLTIGIDLDPPDAPIRFRSDYTRATPGDGANFVWEPPPDPDGRLYMIHYITGLESCDASTDPREIERTESFEVDRPVRWLTTGWSVGTYTAVSVNTLDYARNQSVEGTPTLCVLVVEPSDACGTASAGSECDNIGGCQIRPGSGDFTSPLWLGSWILGLWVWTRRRRRSCGM